jgi:hypothetical protein
MIHRIQFHKDTCSSFFPHPETMKNNITKKAVRGGIAHDVSNTTFNPFGHATRAEAVMMLYNALHKEQNALPDDQNANSRSQLERRSHHE